MEVRFSEDKQHCKSASANDCLRLAKQPLLDLANHSLPKEGHDKTFRQGSADVKNATCGSISAAAFCPKLYQLHCVGWLCDQTLQCTHREEVQGKPNLKEPQSYAVQEFDFRNKRFPIQTGTDPALKDSLITVSYTHLRAHETEADL
eukprot:6368366-Amphidinium_carterae.2